jgi:hypothetical protein
MTSRVLGRKFLSTSYEMATWKSIQSEDGCAKCLGCDLIGGNFWGSILWRLFISFSLEFESVYWAKDLELTDMGSPPPYTYVREVWNNWQSVKDITYPLFCFVLFHVVFRGREVCSKGWLWCTIIPHVKYLTKWWRLFLKLVILWIVFTLPFSFPHSISPSI